MDSLLARLCADLRRGVGCWRRIRNDWGAVCQGQGSDSLKPVFVWEEKGSLWLVTWETEWGFSGEGQAPWLGLPEQPRRVSACVSGEQGGPWYRPHLAVGHPLPPSLHLPPAPSAQALLSGQGQSRDAHACVTRVCEERESSKSLARRAAGWDSCYLPAWHGLCPTAQHPCRHPCCFSPACASTCSEAVPGVWGQATGWGVVLS